MIFYNSNNCTIYLYGSIIEPNAIFKIGDVSETFQLIKENITEGEALRILNYTFNIIEPKVNDKIHKDVVQQCTTYDSVIINSIEGVANTILDNEVYSVDRFNAEMLNKKIGKTKVLIIDNANKVDVGLF